MELGLLQLDGLEVDGGFDTPDDASTTSVLAIGGTVSGWVSNNDRDWYAVNLVAGARYSFQTAAPGGSAGVRDLYLALHDPFGVELELDEDSGPGLDALLTYTAQVTGRFFIEVGENGSASSVNYQITAAQTSPPPAADGIPASSSTTATLGISDSIEGGVGAAGDSDWYRVTLNAGQSYLFGLEGAGGSALIDPYLALYDSSGAVITYNDDGGEGRDASLRFTPTVSGTYFVSAAGWEDSIGGYRLSAAAVAPQNPVDTIDWGTRLSGNQVRIYFATAGEVVQGYTADRAWTTEEQAACLQAAATWSAVCNVSFSQVFSSAEATMIMVLDPTLTASGLMSVPPTVPAVGVFNPAPGFWTPSTLLPGGAAFQTLIHELGHGLGLAHPHDDGGSSEAMEGVTNAFDSYGSAGLNQGVFTVMSYNDGWPGGPPGPLVSYAWGSAGTPMALDIAAVQEDYGIVSRNPGDTTYNLLPILTASSYQYQSIWDTGGIDTITYAGNNSITIDLRSATLTNTIGGGGYVSGTMSAGSGGGFVIAAGVDIENATAGSGADRLIGNDLDNVLIGGPGRDTIDGGLGSDTASYSNSVSAVTVSLLISGPQETYGAAGVDTLISIENLTGSGSDDFLTGNGQANILRGLAGNDTLNGGAGDDYLDGGAGLSDIATYSNAPGAVSVSLAITTAQNTGAAGVDTLVGIEFLVGGAFNDTFWGDAFANTLIGGGGDDSLYGGAGDDILGADVGNNILDGGAGSDWVVLYGYSSGNVVDLSIAGGQNLGGGIGVNTLISIENIEGGYYSDTLSGNDGANILRGGHGNDILNGRGGFDIASYSDAGGAVTVNLGLAGPQPTEADGGIDTLISIEGLEGSNFNDTLIGDGGDNLIQGGRGDDFINGAQGADTASYRSSAGYVRVSLGISSAQATQNAGADTLVSIENLEGSQFADLLTGSDGANLLTGLDGADLLHGMGGDDTLIGGLGDDILTGWGGHDILMGDDGNDFLSTVDLESSSSPDRAYGGTGDDIYSVGDLSDLLFENAGEGVDKVVTTIGFYLYANIENMELTAGSGSIFGVGNELANIITGNEGANLLIGGAGNDALEGNAGGDSLFGEDGDDVLSGGAGVDYLVGGAGGDVLSGWIDADALYGEEGNDTLDGGAGFSTDIMVGGEGADVLDGDSGLGDYDLMDGGSGNDTYQVDTPDDLTFEASAGGTDTVIADIVGAGYYLYANVENLILQGQTPFGVGNELDNVLTGSAIGNYLLGGAGSDTLNGKGGNDVLFGEGGADIFVFERGTGGDVIGDFQVGVDRMDLRGLGFSSFAQVQANMVQNGAVSVIDLGQGDLIVIHNVAMNSFTATDFVI